MIQADRSSAQAISRARILLKIDEGQTALHVVAALNVSERTVFRVKRRHVEEGLEEVLRHHNSLNQYRKRQPPKTGASPPRTSELNSAASTLATLDSAPW